MLNAWSVVMTEATSNRANLARFVPLAGISRSDAVAGRLCDVIKLA
jgi:hypothetical protein